MYVYYNLEVTYIEVWCNLNDSFINSCEKAWLNRSKRILLAMTAIVESTVETYFLLIENLRHNTDMVFDWYNFLYTTTSHMSSMVTACHILQIEYKMGKYRPKYSLHLMVSSQINNEFRKCYIFQKSKNFLMHFQNTFCRNGWRFDSCSIDQ